MKEKKMAIVKLGVVMRAYYPSTKETEAEGSRVQGQPKLHSETLERKGERRRGEHKGEEGKKKRRGEEREKE
jgi:hypothetical protein